MEKLNFRLGVELGRDGQNRPALYLIMKNETWCVFSDAPGICFRKKVGNAREDFTADEVKKKSLGIYKLLAPKWNAICSIVVGEPTKNNN